MSFLVEDDPQATLQDALAFIDACEDSDDGTSGASGASSSGGDEDGHAVASPPPSPANAHHDTSLRVVIRNLPSLGDHAAVLKIHQTSSSQPRAKSATARKTSRSNAVKKHRERKKNEMQTLKEQAVQLQSRLERLQRSARARGCELSSSSSSARQQVLMLDVHVSSANRHHSELQLAPAAATWLDFAALRERERFESEALNTKLRDELRRKLLVSKTLEGVLSKKNAEGLELLLDQQKTQLRQQHNDRLVTTARHFEPTVLAQLQAELQRMYLSTDSVLKSDAGGDTQWPNSGSSSSSIHMRETSDPVMGLCTEVYSSTTVRCSFRDAGLVMWQGTYPQQTTTGPCNVVKRALTTTSFQKSFSIALDSYEKHPVGLSGMAYTRSFDEDERFMFMWTSTIALSGTGPTFVERGWVVASPESSTLVDGGGPLAIVRMYYQASCPSPPQDRGALEEVAFVLKWLGRKTRDFNQRMQDALSDKYSSFQHQPPAGPAS